MRLLYAALVLASPIAALYYWFGGAMGGFHLWEKIPAKVKKWARIYGLLTLLSGGGATALLVTKGCISMGALASYASASAAASAVREKPAPSRSLGGMALPPIKVLTRLRMDTAKRASELKRLEKVRFRAEAQQAILQLPTFELDNSVHARKGPFCHITCTAHHGMNFDRETLPEFCRANWIPPNTEAVPGWWPVDDTREITAAWPGPAVEGFQRYKLYWIDK